MIPQTTLAYLSTLPYLTELFPWMFRPQILESCSTLSPHILHSLHSKALGAVPSEQPPNPVGYCQLSARAVAPGWLRCAPTWHLRSLCTRFTLLHSQLQCVPFRSKPHLSARLLTTYIGFASLLEENHRFCQSASVHLIRGACSHSELVPPLLSQFHSLQPHWTLGHSRLVPAMETSDNYLPCLEWCALQNHICCFLLLSAVRSKYQLIKEDLSI